MTNFPVAGRPTGRVDPAPPLTCGDDTPDTTTVCSSSESLMNNRAAGWAARLRAKLSTRDVEVLESLAILRLLTGDQVRRLHLTEGSPATQARRARSLLKRLSDLRLVVRLGRQVGGLRAGSSGFVYGLSGHGQTLLAVDGPMGGRRRRVWDTSPSFQDHVLAVAETYVQLAAAERAGQIEVLDFQAEPPAWRKFSGASGQTVTLKPDAFVRLGIGEVERSAFLEIDMGTESGPTLARKCLVYASYWRSGIEQQRHGVFPSVLWLAHNHRGADRIAEVVGKLPAAVQHLFEVVLHDDALVTLTTTAQGGRMA